MATHRQMIGRYGALRSWANTADRSARTRAARRNSPSSDEYWLARLDPERFANATDSQKLDAATAARRAYYAELAMKSAAARRRGGDGDAPHAA
jgi:hypothetical protein